MQPLAVQIAAINACGGQVGFAYFMEQGLGKTYTLYLDFMERLAERRATRLVVVCPNSFRSGWVEDAEKHGLDFDFFVWSAGRHNDLRRFMAKKFNKPPCVIVNWEAIRSVSKKVIIKGRERKIWEDNELVTLLKEFADTVSRRAMVAFDESIQAKTYDSAQTIGGISLQYAFGYSRILSGKPITQGPHDLWGQMRLIKQMEDRNYFAFKNAFCKMGGYKAKEVIGAQNEDILSELINPYVFRATKSDWTDLPPKIYTIREYTMTAEMKSMYNSMENDFVLWLNSDEVVSVDAAITKYIKLAQIQCGWIYDEDGKVRWLVEDSKNPRLNLLKEIVDTEIVGKVLIPYVHRPVLEQLIRTFGEANCAFIKGGMTAEEITEQKRRFNEDKTCRFMFLQTKAAKYGHTLLGLQQFVEYRCCTMVLYENTYSLDDRSQIEDRSHRHGQLADAMSYIDLVGTRLDRDCVKALQRKENVFQSVFAPLRRKS